MGYLRMLTWTIWPYRNMNVFKDFVLSDASRSLQKLRLQHLAVLPFP
jgi:hypothetical protein